MLREKNIFSKALAVALLVMIPSAGNAEGNTPGAAGGVHNDSIGDGLSDGRDGAMPDHPSPPNANTNDLRGRFGGMNTVGADRMNGEQREGVIAGNNLSADQIQSVQRSLSDVAPNLRSDGVWGADTQEALKKYQEKEGLNVTGRPDDETLDRLGIER